MKTTGKQKTSKGASIRNTGHYDATTKNVDDYDMEDLVRNMMNLSFSVNDPRPPNWKGNELLIIQTHILNSLIHRVYVNIGTSADIIYEHCFT